MLLKKSKAGKWVGTASAREIGFAVEIRFSWE